METQLDNVAEFAELKELDYRKAGNLAITLWWLKGTQHTYVEVMDMDSTPPTLTEIPVLAGQSAAEVFNHPMYYADQNTK